jgi:hypothetical protein
MQGSKNHAETLSKSNEWTVWAVVPGRELNPRHADFQSKL